MKGLVKLRTRLGYQYFNGVLSVTSIIVLCVSVLYGCKSTSITTGTLTGNVLLVNDIGDPAYEPIDYSGVTIALFSLAEIDTTLLRINNQLPEIGVALTQETEFDHRKQNPYKTAVSNASGSFEIKNIRTGVYNLALIKSGWGTRYIYNINIHEGENTLSEVLSVNNHDVDILLSIELKNITRSDTVMIYPIRVMPSVIQEPMVFLKNRTYCFRNDSVILSSVLIEKGSVLAIDQSCKLDFFDDIQISGDEGFWKITSSHCIDQIDKPDSVNHFNKVSIQNLTEDVVISDLICEYSYDGLQVYCNDLNVTKSMFRYSKALAFMPHAQSNTMSSLMVMHNTQRGLQTFNTTYLNRSIFYNNYDSLLLFEANGNVSNCYYIRNFIGSRVLMGTNTLHNSNYDMNSISVSLCASDANIYMNNFYNDGINIELNAYYAGHTFFHCNPTVINNNFYGDEFYLYGKGKNTLYSGTAYNWWGFNANQIYPNNYLRESNLSSHIYDANYPGVTDFQFTVSFTPRRNSPNTEAGIQL